MGEIDLGAAAEATVHAYKELASDPNKRLPLALDQTCIQFLAYVVAEGAGTLAQSAIDTLQLLADTPDCRPSLANTFGVLEALHEMADDARYSQEMRDHATSLFTCLQFSKHVKSSTDEASSKEDKEKGPLNPELASQSSLLSQDSIDSISSASERAGLCLVAKKSKSKSKEKSFLGPFNSKAKMITLYIEGMQSKDDRIEVEDELVRVRGLISIVFDLSKSRVTCRVKRDLGIDKLVGAISKTDNFRAKQVVNGPDGEELVVNIGDVKSNIISPIDDLPDYLPEEDAPIKDAATAIAPTGSFKNAATSFISAAANLLQNSFYW